MASSCWGLVRWERKKRVLLVSGSGSVWLTGVASVMMVEVSAGDDLEEEAAGFLGVFGEDVFASGSGLSCL